MDSVRIDAAHEIGGTAGAIWHFLHANGPVAVSTLTKELDQPKDVILQGIGWLAREGKVEYFAGKGNKRTIGLT